jgi:hypothetical protein
MSSQPTFDKCCAYFVLLRALGARDGDFPVEFHGVSSGDDDRIRELKSQGFYALDVGNNKYQNRGCTSALEVVCRDFGVELDEPLRQLHVMVGQNNKTGYLKGHSFSLVWALREAYKLERDPRKVVSKVLAIIDAFFRIERTSEREREWPTVGRYASLNEVMLALGDSALCCDLFTLAYFVNVRFSLGDPITEIRDEALWWLRVFNASSKAEDKTAANLEFVPRQEFKVCGLPACAFETNDPRAGRYLLTQLNYAVVVVRRSSGNVAILSNKQLRFDMSAVASELKCREGEIWFYDDRLQACLNGSTSWSQPATSLSFEEIIQIVCEKAKRPR